MALAERLQGVVDDTRALWAHANWMSRTAVGLAVASALLVGSTLMFERLAMGSTGKVRALRAELVRARSMKPEPRERLEDLAAPADQWISDVRDVYELADRFDLHIASARYEPVERASSGFLLRRVTFHLRDEYPQVKPHLAAVLENAPHAFIASLSLERSDPSSAVVDVALTLVFVYRVGARPTGIRTTAEGASAVGHSGAAR